MFRQKHMDHRNTEKRFYTAGAKSNSSVIVFLWAYCRHPVSDCHLKKNNYIIRGNWKRCVNTIAAGPILGYAYPQGYLKHLMG